MVLEMPRSIGLVVTCITDNIMYFSMVATQCPKRWKQEFLRAPSSGHYSFWLYMNEIKEACKTFIPILYADDTGLVSSLCSFYQDDKLNICEISRNINDELFYVQEWLNVNKLSLNVYKTKYMIFHHRQRKIDEFIPDIRINDSPIERVTDFNFLALQFDQHLNWNAHIQKCSNKISRTLGVMNRRKRYLPTKILRVLYNSLVLPHLQYAILS